MPCLIVREEGQWKFDLPGSMDRLFGGGLDAMVQQLASTMATAMEGVGQAMAEGLKEAFGGMSGEAPAASDEAPAPPAELPAPKPSQPKRKGRAQK